MRLAIIMQSNWTHVWPLTQSQCCRIRLLVKFTIFIAPCNTIATATTVYRPLHGSALKQYYSTKLYPNSYYTILFELTYVFVMTVFPLTVFCVVLLILVIPPPPPLELLELENDANLRWGREKEKSY